MLYVTHVSFWNVNRFVVSLCVHDKNSFVYDYMYPFILLSMPLNDYSEYGRIWVYVTQDKMFPFSIHIITIMTAFFTMHPLSCIC